MVIGPWSFIPNCMNLKRWTVPDSIYPLTRHQNGVRHIVEALLSFSSLVYNRRTTMRCGISFAMGWSHVDTMVCRTQPTCIRWPGAKYVRYAHARSLVSGFEVSNCYHDRAWRLKLDSELTNRMTEYLSIAYSGECIHRFLPTAYTSDFLRTRKW